MSKYSAKASAKILAPEGVHPARCVRFIELGTQDMGEFGDKFRCQISYELVEESAVFNEDKGEQPFVVHKTYNRSLHKRSDMGKAVRVLLGVKDFDPDEEIDMDDILDQPCMVEIVHSEDGQYANVAAVTAVPKGTKVKKSETDTKSLYLDDSFDEDVFDSLHDSLKEKIEESPEYKELGLDNDKPKSRKGGKDKPSNKKGRKDEDEEEEDEDEEDDRPKRNKRSAKKEKPERKKPARRK